MCSHQRHQAKGVRWNMKGGRAGTETTVVIVTNLCWQEMGAGDGLR